MGIATRTGRNKLGPVGGGIRKGSGTPLCLTRGLGGGRALSGAVLAKSCVGCEVLRAEMTMGSKRQPCREPIA
eukprot:1226705-Pleurochrysis_carterae.AAC.2